MEQPQCISSACSMWRLGGRACWAQVAMRLMPPAFRDCPRDGTAIGRRIFMPIVAGVWMVVRDSVQKRQRTPACKNTGHSFKLACPIARIRGSRVPLTIQRPSSGRGGFRRAIFTSSNGAGGLAPSPFVKKVSHCPTLPYSAAMGRQNRIRPASRMGWQGELPLKTDCTSYRSTSSLPLPSSPHPRR